jgi:hypothetical protein
MQRVFVQGAYLAQTNTKPVSVRKKWAVKLGKL